MQKTYKVCRPAMQRCKPYRFIKDRLTVNSTTNPLHTMLLYGYTGWVVQT
jgi:hypothetical protein